MHNLWLIITSCSPLLYITGHHSDNDLLKAPLISDGSEPTSPFFFNFAKLQLVMLITIR